MSGSEYIYAALEIKGTRHEYARTQTNTSHPRVAESGIYWGHDWGHSAQNMATEMCNNNESRRGPGSFNSNRSHFVREWSGRFLKKSWIAFPMKSIMKGDIPRMIGLGVFRRQFRVSHFES